MDQEISRVTWTGAAMLALVGAISAAIMIYGFGRHAAINEINTISRQLVDDNVKELRQLNESTMELTPSSLYSIIDRNDGAIKNVIIMAKTISGDTAYTYDYDPDLMLTVKDKMTELAPGLLNYTTTFRSNPDGTVTIRVYAY